MEGNHYTRADFDALVDREMAITIGAAATVATLKEIRTLKSPSPRPGEPFALLFHVPAEIPPMQGTHKLEHPSLGCIELFMVPLGPMGPVMRYEAIFN